MPLPMHRQVSTRNLTPWKASPCTTKAKAMSSVSVDSKFEDRCGDAGTLANDIPTIRAYSPVSRARVAHLFFDAPYFSRTCKTFQVPERTPAHLVRALHPRLHPRTNTAPRLCGKDPVASRKSWSSIWDQQDLPCWVPSRVYLSPAARFPQKEDKGISLGQVRAPIAQLCNSNSSILVVDTASPLKINALKEDFRGALQLYAGLALRDGFNMLIHAPTGLHSTEPGYCWGG